MKKLRMLALSLVAVLASACTVFADVADPAEQVAQSIILPVLLIAVAVIVIVLVIRAKKKK